MTPHLEKLRDELAKEAFDESRAHHVPNYYQMMGAGFKRGWDSLHKILTDAAGEFPLSEANEYALSLAKVARINSASPRIAGFMIGARWQFEQDAVMIGLAEITDKEVVQEERSYGELIVLNKQFKARIKQLEARVAEKTEIADRHYRNCQEQAHKLTAANERIKELEASEKENERLRAALEHYAKNFEGRAGDPWKGDIARDALSARGKDK